MTQHIPERFIWIRLLRSAFVTSLANCVSLCLSANVVAAQKEKSRVEENKFIRSCSQGNFLVVVAAQPKIGAFEQAD